MLRRTEPFLFLLVALAALMSACGDSGPGGGETSKALVPATERGLAAAVLAHVPSADVTYVGGKAFSDDPATDEMSLSVMVETRAPARSVFINVRPAESAYDPGECGGDALYRSVICVTEPHFLEVGVRNVPKRNLPSVEGWLYDESRGGVLVQAFGSDSPAAQELVHHLLEDSLVGTETSPDMNQAGERLTDFEVLKGEIMLR